MWLEGETVQPALVPKVRTSPWQLTNPSTNRPDKV